MSAIVPKPIAIEATASHGGVGRPTRVSLLSPIRRGPRSDEIRIAEYAPFPRDNAHQQTRLGFTRDVSALGMCLGVDPPEPIGTLLRVDVRHLNGQSMGASIARVVWCTGSRDGRHWLGLDLLCETDDKRGPEAIAG